VRRLLAVGLLVTSVGWVSPRPGAAQVQDVVSIRPALTLAGAERLVDAALRRAEEGGWRMVVAVVDGGGHLVQLARMDGVQLASLEIAVEKARGAVRFRRPTSAPAEWVRGNPAYLGLPGIVPVAGGVPLWAGDEVVGGIGVSGATAVEDALVADAAAASVGFPFSEPELPRRRR